MSTVSVTSVVSSSSNVQYSGKTAGQVKKPATPQLKGDLVPIEAINADFQKCAPLYVTDTSRVYRDTQYVNIYEAYSAWVKPMAVDSTQYVLGTKSEGLEFNTTIKDLDLGTRLLHIVQENRAYHVDTLINSYLLPVDTSYVTYIQDMMRDIDYTWHDAGLGTPTPAGDLPEMQRPYEFMQCVLATVGINSPTKEISNKNSDIQIYQTASGEIKIRFHASGNDHTSVRILDITGKLVSDVSCKETDLTKNMTATWKASKASSGLYECVVESGNTLIIKKILIVK